MKARALDNMETNQSKDDCLETDVLETNKEVCHENETDSSSCNDMADFVRGAMLLQERWVLMIVFSLLTGPIGFSELMRRGSVNTTTLTQRLNLLEQAGLLVKTIHSTMPPRTSYQLTEAGAALEPILIAIGKWSGKYLPAAKAAEACSSREACAGDEVFPRPERCPSET